MIKALAKILLVVLLVVATGLTLLYGVSEYMLRDVTPEAVFVAEIPTDSMSVERGRHIARTRGCFGCHGEQLEGLVFFEQWEWFDRAVAPNLAAYARTHDKAVIERAIRQGIGHDGRALWSMPSYNWVHLTDEDVASLIAFLRSAPAVEKDLPPARLGIQVRWSLVTGRDVHMPDLVKQSPPLIEDAAADSSLAPGQYLAMTTCNECHGFDLRGQRTRWDIVPDLAIVAAYSDEDFRRLMRSGIALGDRELGLMTLVARSRFAYFNEDELASLQAFLKTLSQRPIPENVPWRDNS